MLSPLGFKATSIADNELAVAPRQVSQKKKKKGSSISVGREENSVIDTQLLLLTKSISIRSLENDLVMVICMLMKTDLNRYQGREKLGRWKRLSTQSTI